MDNGTLALLSSLIGLLAVISGVIAGGIYKRLTREPVRGCDQCGAKLTTTEGTSCSRCVTRRRALLDDQANRSRLMTDETD